MRTVSLPRTGSSPPHVRTTPVYRMLPGGIGYADLDRLEREEVAPMFDSLQSAGVIIFDMRGYPKGTAWPITARLTDTTLVVAKFSRPQMSGLDLAGSLWSGSPSFSFDQLISPEGKRYRGRIVVLINAEAGSQSEHTCLFLEAAADATFIGSPTMGSNGDVTNVILPGGIFCSFSGHDVRHADGGQLQRIGILPHIAVEPTVRGIRDGRDEVLEAAVKFVRSGARRPE